MALGAQEAKVVDIDGASAVVCVRPAVCGTDGQCFEPCASDMSCLGAGFPHCNTETGRCECTEDADCQLSPLPQHAVCIEGKCGCSTDAQCFDGKVGDVCSGGVCGCSDDVACSEVTQQYDGGSVTCVMQ
jgi:hypothetical protein